MSFNDTMKAIADPTRRSILNLLKDGSKTAGDIAGNFDINIHLFPLQR